MANLIQFRRDIASNWKSDDPILAQGELGYETDTNKFKIGDGEKSWNALEYFSSGSNDDSSVAYPSLSYIKPSVKGKWDYGKGLYSDIEFGIDATREYIEEHADDLYISMYRYGPKGSTQDDWGGEYYPTQSYQRQDDSRHYTNVKMYCWRYIVRGIEYEGYDQTCIYFYTLDNYGHDPVAMMYDNPNIWVGDNYNETWYQSNYATCFNALYNVGEGIQGYIDPSEAEEGYVERYSKFDISSYAQQWLVDTNYFDKLQCNVRSKGGKNYYFWCRDWTGKNNTEKSAVVYEEPIVYYIPEQVGKPLPALKDIPFLATATMSVEDCKNNYTLVEKRHDLDWYKFIPQGHPRKDEQPPRPISISTLIDYCYESVYQHEYGWGQMNWCTYWFDYPIEPVRLTDCQVWLEESLPYDPEQEYHPGTASGKWRLFREVLQDSDMYKQLCLLDVLRFKLPYTTYDLWMRIGGWQKACYWEKYNDGEGCRCFYKNNLEKATNFDNDTPFNSRKFGRAYVGLKYNVNGHNNNRLTENIQFGLNTGKEISEHKRGNASRISKKLTLSSRGCNTTTSLQ